MQPDTDANKELEDACELARSLKPKLIAASEAADLHIYPSPSTTEGPHLTLIFTHNDSDWGNVDSAYVIYGKDGKSAGEMKDVDTEFLMTVARDLRTHFLDTMTRMGSRAEWEAKKG